jgi:hypothetical protein
VQPTSTMTIYKLDDGTGVVEVRLWNDSDDNAEQASAAPVAEGTYVRVFGNLRVFQGKTNVVAFAVRPITDFNEVTYHSLEAIFVHLGRVKAMGAPPPATPMMGVAPGSYAVCNFTHCDPHHPPHCSSCPGCRRRLLDEGRRVTAHGWISRYSSGGSVVWCSVHHTTEMICLRHGAECLISRGRTTQTPTANMGAYTGGAPAANMAAGGETLQSKLIALFESPQATSSDAGMSTDEVYAAFQSIYPAATIRQSVCAPLLSVLQLFVFLSRNLWWPSAGQCECKGDVCGRNGWCCGVVA